MGIYLGFDSLEEFKKYLESLHFNTEFEKEVQFGTFPSDKNLVLLMSRWHKDKNLKSQLEKYKGEAFIFDDDDPPQPERMDIFNISKERGWVFGKTQFTHPETFQYKFDRQIGKLNPSTYKPVLDYITQKGSIFPYGLTSKPLNYFKNQLPECNNEKSFDFTFIGSLHYRGRFQHLNYYQQALTQLNAKFCIISGGLDIEEYIKILNKSKVCISLIGVGPRCRREAEVQLAGSLLLNEIKVGECYNYQLPGMDSGKHFIWEEPNFVPLLQKLIKDDEYRKNITQQGQERARDLFIKSPNIHLRLAYFFLENKNNTWDLSYESLVNWEKQKGLVWA